MTKTVRFKVRHGRLEPLEPVELAEGTEVEILVPVEEAPAKGREQHVPRFRSWKMGVKEPLTREGMHEDE